MNIMAIIPARGGSKSIPRKNLAILDGVTLLQRTVSDARLSHSIWSVIVSTDDDEIAEKAGLYGAGVVRRPPELSTDFSPSEEALVQVLNNIEEHPDIVVMLQCTSPFRAPDDIDNAIRMVVRGGYDSVLSCVPQNQFVWNDHGRGAWSVNYDPVAGQRPMRQSVKSYVENGSIYVFRRWVLEHYGSRLGGKIGVYEMQSKWSAIEIDEPDDLELAQWVIETGREP